MDNGEIINRANITRSTSREAYQSLIASGSITKDQKEIVTWLYQNVEGTRNELAAALNKNPNDTSSRLRELWRIGVVEIVGKGKCRVSGRTISVHALTGNQHNGKRCKLKVLPIKTLTVSRCDSCAFLNNFQDERSGEMSANCWLDDKVFVIEDEQPHDCPLRTSRYVVVGDLTGR